MYHDTHNGAVDNFQYTPLNNARSSFRMLKLLKGDLKTDIECEIFHSPILSDDVISYEALSYTWGNMELVECIEVNRQSLWITENLCTALKYLRSRDQDRLLWIDAICIDQSNDEERSQQVQKMGMIYSLANRVVFWLGKPTVEAALLLTTLNELQNKSVLLSDEGSIVHDIVWKKLWSEVRQRSNRRELQLRSQKRLRTGLRFLLKRPWFQRVWILQEVAKAQSAVVCSGFMSVPAHIFAVAPSLLGLDTDGHVQSVLDIMPGPARKDSLCSRERSLFNLLTKFRGSQATDPRDMIFALLGMSSEPADHKLLRADYTKPVEEVVHNTIRYWYKASSISTSQILHYLTGFKTVHTTYLIPLQKATTVKAADKDLVRLPSLSGGSEPVNDVIIECIRDPDLFLLEQRPDGKSSHKKAFEVELNKLSSILDVEIPWTATASRDILQIVPWPGDERNVNLLIMRDVTKTLLLVAAHAYQQLFSFIAKRFGNDKQKLLNNVLYEALTKRFQMAAVELILDEGAELEADGGYYGNALQAASSHGNEEIVQMILDRGASVNPRGGRFGNALQAATEGGHEKIIQMLLDEGADVNAQVDFHGTALQLAAHSGRDKILQMLLDRGANINVQGGPYRNTPLIAASAAGHERVVRMLLDNGADVNARGGESGNALCTASYSGHENIAQLLLDWGADVQALGKYYDHSLEKLVEGTGRREENTPRQLDGTALQIALYRHHDAVVKVLSQHMQRHRHRKNPRAKI